MEVAAAIKEKGGHIEGRVMWVKALASAATIGSGGSAGREGPVVQIGAAVASFLGRLMRVPEADLRMLVAGGAAGGIAASFSIPLAGVFFTMEVILRDLANEGFSAIVIAAVTATVTARLLLGADVFFTPLAYEWHRPTEFFFYALLGVLAAPVGLAYRGMMKRFEDLFAAHRRLPDWLRPALGGFLVGALALALPQIRGTGQEAMNEVMLGRGVGWALVLLAAGKMFATALTLGSGGSGGSLMPALYVGTTAGGFYAFALNEIAGTRLEPGAFGLVGLACVFCAAFRAPVTAVVMGLEIARDYGILMPVMFGCVITHLVARGRREKTHDSGLAAR
jgi:CIC family chloride channel protein